MKNKKVKVDDDDEEHYMNFFRFKHLIDRRNRIENRTNRGTQTEIATNNDKATDTLNDFDEVLEPFRLKMRSENFENNQKATQTNAMRDQETEPRVKINDEAYTLKGSERAFRSKQQQQRRDMMIQVYTASLRGQTPSDTDEENDRRDRASMASRLVSDMGLAGLQLGLSATSMLMRGAVGLYDAMQSQQQEEEEEEEDASADASRSIRDEQIVGQDASASLASSRDASADASRSIRDVDEINSSPPITVNSSSSSSNDQDVDINDEWMRRRSRSRSSTPDREYPKKK